MTSPGEPPVGEQPTFADVLNGLAFGGRRARRAPPPPPPPPIVDDDLDPGHAAAQPPPVDDVEHDADPEEPDDVDGVEADAVRPYSWTRGRTHAELDLQVETLVSAFRRLADTDPAPLEHRAICELCQAPQSVAEVAAALGVPLGVAKVLISDMAKTGLLTVHRTVITAGSQAQLDLMERVLSGLRRL
jgi:Protein of unknown function (DUF742)